MKHIELIFLSIQLQLIVSKLLNYDIYKQLATCSTDKIPE